MKDWATPTGGELPLEIVRQDEGVVPVRDRPRVLGLPHRTHALDVLARPFGACRRVWPRGDAGDRKATLKGRRIQPPETACLGVLPYPSRCGH